VSDKLPITESTGSAGNADYNRVYTQQEVDALIAGAYLAQRKLVEKLRTLGNASRIYTGNRNPTPAGAAYLVIADELEQILTLAAARLALEEREARIRDDAFEEVVAIFQGTLKAWTPYETIQAIRALKGTGK
jgi:hypothetical protein